MADSVASSGRKEREREGGGVRSDVGVSAKLRRNKKPGKSRARPRDATEVLINGSARGGIRTHDLRLRRPTLYPAELLARRDNGAVVAQL